MLKSNQQQTTTKQLKISFDAKSTLKQNLREGQFSVLLEYAAPAADQPFKLAIAPGVALAKYLAQDKRLASLAVTGNDRAVRTHPAAAVAKQLLPDCGKEVIVYLSGRAQTNDTLREALATLASAGITSVAALTGGADPDHPRDPRGRPLPFPEGYLDSTRMLRLIRAQAPDFFLGATINPAKYTVADTHLQYYKMVKKLACGAQFFLSQAGWDMRKLQELQWYMRLRGLDEPVLARLLLVRPKDLADVLAGKWGGLAVSRQFAAQLQREATDNEEQALRTQIERLALQAAGCRLLGYSGIQLAGLGDASTAERVVNRVFERLAEVTAFAAWVKAWNEFHERVELSPAPHGYYVFRQLLHPDHLDYNASATPFSPQTCPPPTRGERWAYRLAAGLGLAHGGNPLARVLRGPLCGWQPGAEWQLAKTAMRCAAACPKGLEDGPCSGSLPDGTCEFGHQPCFYHRVFALRHWRNELARFEAADED